MVEEVSPLGLASTEDVEPKKRFATVSSCTSNEVDADRTPPASTIAAMGGAG